MRSALLGSLLVLAGCTATPAPSDRYFRLQLDDRPLNLPAAVQVQPVRVSGVVQERPLLFSRPESPQQLEQRPFAFWERPPAELFTAALRRRLQAENPIADAPIQLQARLLRCEQVLSSAAPAAVLELELSWQIRGGPRELRHYTERRPARTSEPAAAVDALSEALEIILSRWLAELPASRPEN